jgi:hypothetical protein
VCWKARAKLGRPEPPVNSPDRERLKQEILLSLGNAPPGFRDLQAFTQAVTAGKPPPPDLMRRLAVSFAEIVDGRPADKALRLQRKGRKPPTSRQLAERVGVAFRVEKLRRGGATKDAAIAAVAQSTRGLDFDRAKQWYETHRDDARRHLRMLAVIEQQHGELRQSIATLPPQAD